MMLVIPAIDIKGGQCVRLQQGRFEDETVYFADPVKTAQLWRIENAKILHLVDLDGALSGNRANLDIIKKIVNSVDIPVQIGGGIRTLDDIRSYLEIGVCRVIIGTAAVKNPDLVRQAIEEFGPRAIIVGIDASNGKVAIKGWTETSPLDAVDLALQMKEYGLQRIIFTDISKDGMLQGPNLEATRNLAVRSGIKITASGGVSGFRDLVALKELEPVGVDSVIVGKALYENRFPCQVLWRECEKGLVVEKEIKVFTEHDFRKKPGAVC